mmetsp:Transcript_5915/g.10087  ORF Transcript_5915/g.10087 Transcript_5915/m.10087 type:complete len:219 (+) Transcript_5915:144-800(+)
MSYLLKILPSTLKTQLAKFLYNDAIQVNRFLEDRDDNFYSKYLEELKSERFVKGDMIAKSGNRADFVYFIMNGVVHNLTTDRYFEAGQMINHDCIIQKTSITQDYIAESDVSALKYERETFLMILDQFPDINEDMQQIVKDKMSFVENQKFIKNKINDQETRNLIINHYKDIVQEEKDIYRKQKKSIALRLVNDSFNPHNSFKIHETRKKPKNVQEFT